MKLRTLFYITLFSIISAGCNNGPKVITSQPDNESMPIKSGIFDEENTNDQNINLKNSYLTDNLHSVVVNEILKSPKYSYLYVTENGEQFWIATRKQDVVVGDTYFYKTGLLKTNYESKEHNKVFDKIYLVSNLVAENHNNNSGNIKSEASTNIEKTKIQSKTSDIVPKSGSIKIAAIVANQNQYNGKTVQLTGKCVKINPNIMERNWIHLQDGSQDDFDLVVTSNTFVNEGSIITIRAKVSLNKDFGAGYTYDLILEDGVLVE